MSLQSLDTLEPVLGQISSGSEHVTLPCGTYPFVQLRRAAMHCVQSISPVELHGDYVDQLLTSDTGLQVLINTLAATGCELNDEDLFEGFERKLYEHANELFARDAAGRTPNAEWTILGIKYLYGVVSGYRKCVLGDDSSFTNLGELLSQDKTVNLSSIN